MGERLTDLVGERVTVTNPIHTESRWTGQAIAYSDGPVFLVETEDGHRLMLPATWATKAESAAAPKRIQMSRQRPWRAESPDAVIVARPTEWGNPISLVDVGGQYPSLDTEAVARMVVQDFRALANRGTLSFPNWRHAGGERGPVTWTYPSLDRIRAELGGRDLACWCALDQACHADVLLDLANGPSA